MPLLLDKKTEYNTRIAVWRVTEPDSFFADSLKLTAAEKKACSQMRPHRKSEWLSSRFLLHKISRDSVRQPLLKDVYGKPHRQDKKGYISISHSRHMVAVMQSDRLAGLDIQVPEEKIARIQHKFISDRERCMLPKKNLLDYYHVFWGGKESMYKAYGKRELDFRKHMHLYPFRIGQGITELKGCVSKGDVYQLYDLEVDRVEQAYLVSCVMGE